MKYHKEKLKKVCAAGFLAIAFSMFAGVTFTTFAAEVQKSDVLEGVSYTPLVNLPLGEQGGNLSSWTLSTYLSGMLRLIIALGGAVAVLMAIIGGVQYVASGITPSAKNDAKDRITNAFIGLAIILTSYLLLNTISPDLVNFKLALPVIEIEGVAAPETPQFAGILSNSVLQRSGQCVSACDPGYVCASFIDASGDEGASCQPLEVHGCSDCRPLSISIPTKGYGVACAKNVTGACSVDEDLKPKLEKLNTALVTQGINWWVTEAYPPTREHRAACQRVGTSSSGTCIDANFKNPRPTPEDVKKFLDIAKKSGLRAVYEVDSKADRDNLHKSLDPSYWASIIFPVDTTTGKPWITGDHFSIYST